MIPSLEKLKDSRLKTKRSPHYVSIAIPTQLNQRIVEICKELDCYKSKFVTLAINKLITEYEKESAE
mgnify:FL=1